MGGNHELSSLLVCCFGFILLDYGEPQDSSAVIIIQPETLQQCVFWEIGTPLSFDP